MRNRSVLLSAATGPLFVWLQLGDAKDPRSEGAGESKHWNAARASVLASLANEQFASGNFEKCRRTTWTMR